ncbi:MAG TPA: Asp23/Gls24 family envelope stress response protein [Anaerolineae bacterium]|jgi:uncharacterized alkaline shock family protein YloU
MNGKVTISPEVIRDIARVTTLATTGVLALAERQPRSKHGEPDTGVDVLMDENEVSLRLRVIAAVNQPLYKLGDQIKTTVAAAIAEISGITVTSVDVTFEDVRSKA